MSRKAQPISVCIIGRRHFDGCNTYCTAQIFLAFRKAPQVLLHSEYETGGGDYYEQAAAEVIEAAGHMPGRDKYPWGGSAPAWQYFRDNRGVAYHAEAADVKRKKDLHLHQMTAKAREHLLAKEREMWA